MSNRPDLLVVGPDGEPKLAVEVKTTKTSSVEWASQFRRNLLAHGVVPSKCFFLLASQDRFFLWSPRDNGLESPPDFVADSRQALGPWLDRMHTPSGKMSEPALELLIQSWLSEIMTDSSPRDPEFLGRSGLHSAIQGARLRSQWRH